MSRGAQLLVMLLVAALLTAGLYFGLYQSMAEQNDVAEKEYQAQKAQVEELRKFENDIPRLNQQIATLQEQLEIQKRIVPDEKEADKFMHLLQNTAQSAGIEIRRWTAKPTATREYYVEVPFDLELDGPYYSVLNFFDKVAHLERIVNVSSLQLGSLKGKGDSKFRHNYQYAPRESVVGACTATTFFSHDGAAAPAGAAKKPVAK